LLRPELDVWEPGEHNGTFRGNNLGFIGATAAIENFWRDGNFAAAIQRKAKQVSIVLDRIVAAIGPDSSQRRGRGLYQGIAFGETGLAEQIAGALFKEGMVIETCGPASEVLKLIPPLTIKDADLDTALEMIFETSCRLAKIPATRRNFIQ
jgi:diaminobutyrate-2-oxoglutarate transaminase